MKATNWMGQEIKGVIVKLEADGELLNFAFDYLSDKDRYEYTFTYVVFTRYLNGKLIATPLTTKKHALETAKNYDKGEAIVGFARKSFSTPKKLVGCFGQWALVSN